MTTRTQPALRAMPSEAQSVTSLPQVSVGLTTLQGFELAQRAAKCLASSTLVPKEYQGNLSNCIIALNMAQRIGADPLMVMQNLVIVHGRPTWSSQFLIATFNTCGKFSALRYEFFGEPGTDGWGCRATATELSTGEKLTGTDVTIAIAKKEGWYGRNGSKWQSMPQQMLQYRAASWFVRTIAPELSMGLQTADEMHDVYDATPTASGAYEVVDQEPIKSARPEPERPAEVETPAETVIDQETGEILQPADTDEPDQYTDLRAALGECQSISDLTRLIGDLSPAQKTDEALMNLIRGRQAELKG